MENNIKNLLGKDVKVQVEDLDRYISTQGVIVRVSIGGGRNSYYISNKMYGVKEEGLTEEGKEFLDEHTRNGSIVFVPRSFEDKLNRVESRIRKKLKELAIGYDNSFIPLSSYPEFKEYFEKCKKEFFQLRENLVERYAFMYRRFIVIAKQSLEDLNATQAREELNKVISKLPSREKFKNSFRFEMSVSAFPTKENLMLFEDEEIKEDIKKMATRSSTDLVKDATLNVINEGITGLTAIIKSAVDTGKIHQRSMYGLRNSINKIGLRNIFANSRLNEIKSRMSDIPTLDDDSAIELAEQLLAELYGYSTELGIEEEVDLTNSLISKEELINMYEFYKEGVGA